MHNITMIRLHILVEGQTERKFVKDILTPHLAQYKVYPDARIILTKRDKRKGRQYKGGLFGYLQAKKELLQWIKEDDHPECRFTTMFDFYALPDDFPGKSSLKNAEPYQRLSQLEEAFSKDINKPNFIPYIQFHEFEALVFSDPEKLNTEYFDREKQISTLKEILAGFQNKPELINEGKDTAPSKRILKEIPEYDKVQAGVNILKTIGLDTIRKKCSHFNKWFSNLETLANHVK